MSEWKSEDEILFLQNPSINKKGKFYRLKELNFILLLFSMYSINIHKKEKTMKKSISLLLFFFIIIGFVAGKQIDENTAKNAGYKFLYEKEKYLTMQSPSGLILVYTSRSEETYSDNSGSKVYYYIFNTTTPKGFVIISGDDRVIPVLGYSDQEAFNPENIPAHVVSWLEGYKNQIQYAIEKDLSSTEEIRTRWKELTGNIGSGDYLKSTSAVGPLIQTKWDQSPYYNALCPYDNYYNDRTVTGCVATAMAQVMKYWEYPSTGSGFHSYNSNNYGTLSADFGGTTYNWGSMPNSVTGSNDAVATLMYQCGVSVDMNYGVGSQGGSGAYVVSSQSPVEHCAEYALETYFGYPNNLQGVVRANYSEDQWVSLLKTELDASRPIIYAGFGNGGGHCFVCDGYDQSNYFHFNWGWSGYYDGYFSINALDPGGTGTGGGTGGFNSGHQAIIGVKSPGGGGGQTTTLQLYNSVQASKTTINYGEDFSIWTDLINAGNSNFSGQYCAAAFDYNLNFVDFVGNILNEDNLPPNYHYTNGITFETNGLLSMLPGTYYIAVYYRPTGGNWYLVEDGNYSNLVVMTVINPNDIELYEEMNITPGNVLTQGGLISVHLDVANYGSSTFTGIIDLSLYNLDGSLAFTIESKNEEMPPNTHFTNGLTFSNSHLDIEPGTYLMAVLHQRSGSGWELTGSSYHQNPVFVTVQAEDLQADPYESNNSPEQAYVLPVNFTGNTASVNTQGSNCHTGEDYDFYRIDLDAGFSYNVSAELFDSHHPGSGQYSLDAIYSFNVDGVAWSDAYEGLLSNPLVINNGGTVVFFVSPKFTGATGTYRFDIYITKNPLGINDNGLAGFVRIYPNPARQFLTIDFSKFSGNAETIQLLSILGKDVSGIIPVGRRQQITLSAADIPEGMYLLHILTDKGIIVKEIIISR